MLLLLYASLFIRGAQCRQSTSFSNGPRSNVKQFCYSCWKKGGLIIISNCKVLTA